MIEINLTPGERDSGGVIVAGMDVSLFNVKLIVIFIFLVYLVEPIVDVFYVDEIETIRSATVKHKGKLRKLKKDLRQYDAIKDQVKKLNLQQENLNSKIKIVKEIVDKRQNPFVILKYIADNTPKNVWLAELEITDKNLKISGYSKSWKSIGSFIENLKDSIFFNGNVKYTQNKATSSKKRFESFELTTSIVSFK